MKDEVRKIQKDLFGLWLIIDQGEKNNTFISRGYIKEKLFRIIKGCMGFHPSIKDLLTDENLDKFLRGGWKD